MIKHGTAVACLAVATVGLVAAPAFAQNPDSNTVYQPLGPMLILYEPETEIPVADSTMFVPNVGPGSSEILPGTMLPPARVMGSFNPAGFNPMGFRPMGFHDAGFNSPGFNPPPAPPPEARPVAIPDVYGPGER